MTMNSYQYSPLPEGRHFRLLQIVPKGKNTNSDNAPAGSATTTSTSEPSPKLSVELKTFPIDQAPPYWALSYTWGHPCYGLDGEEPDPAASQASIAIDCGGAPMQIGENLHEFLCFSRERGLFTGNDSPLSPPFPNRTTPLADMAKPSGSGDWLDGCTAYLWADAICINQESLEERAHQVQLMRAIYTLSRRVVVWLGPQMAPPEAVWALDTFLPSAFKKLWRDALVQCTLEFEDGKVVNAFGAEECARWRAAYPGLFHFLSRARWFSRGWTVQEVLLKKPWGDVDMLCGSGPLSFSSFMILTVMISNGMRLGSMDELYRKIDKFSRESSQNGSHVSGRMVSRATSLPTLKRVWRLMSEAMTARGMTKWQRVLKLIINMSSNSFTDPRDRVFGCLGLIETIVPETDLRSILPNYTVSTDEVMTSLAGLLYKNIYELEYMFSMAGFDPKSTSTLPSWVPDFVAPKEHGWIPLVPHGLLANSQGGFNASKLFPVSECCAGVDIDSKTLLLSGAKLDVVKEPSLTHKPRRFSSEWIIEYFKEDECYPHGSTANGQSRPAAVLRSLRLNDTIMQRKKAERSHPSDTAEHVATTARDWYLQVFALSISHGVAQKEPLLAGLTAANKRHPDWLPTATEVEVLAAEMGQKEENTALEKLGANAWDHQIMIITNDRRLFVTEGGLLGLGPLQTRSGDEVWIIRGSRMPVLLRKVDNAAVAQSFRLIGETYVHGVMSGEAVTEEFESQFAPVKLI